MSGTPIQGLFSQRSNPAGVRPILKNKANPLNWYERMRERKAEKEAQNAMSGMTEQSGALSGLASAYRNIDDKLLILTSRIGKGDGKEFAKLAAMDDVKYYNDRSNVLKLARMNTKLKEQIRAAIPGDQDPVVKAVAEAADGEDGEASVASVDEAVDAEAAAVGGGAALGGDAAIAPPDGYAAVLEAVDRLPAKGEEALPVEAGGAAGGEALPDVPGIPEDAPPIVKQVAKYGAVKSAPLGLLLDVFIGRIPSNEAARQSIYEFFRNIKLPIGSPQMISYVIYERDHTIATEAQIRAEQDTIREGLLRSLKGVKTPLLTRKELDKALKDEEQLWKIIKGLDKFFTGEELLKPFEGDFETPAGKEQLRDGVNSLFSLLNSKVKPEDRSNLEVRKESNASRIGTLYLDGKPLKVASIVDYTAAYGLFTAALENITKSPQYSNEDYPNLKRVFDILEDQFQEAGKKFRERGTGGRPKGAKNKPKTPAEAVSAIVNAALNTGVIDPSLGGEAGSGEA